MQLVYISYEAMFARKISEQILFKQTTGDFVWVFGYFTLCWFVLVSLTTTDMRCEGAYTQGRIQRR